MTTKGNMTTLWEGYADWDCDPSWDAVAVRIRVEPAYNKFHSYGLSQPIAEMAGVFEEEFDKADKNDQAFIRALVHKTHNHHEHWDW